MKNEIINEVIRIAEELKRPPTRDEFTSKVVKVSPYSYQK